MESPHQINRDPNFLMPYVKEKLLLALEDCRKQGINVALFEGYRTPERQDLLYSQGRTNKMDVVTNAKAWQSFHNYGLACDIVGKKPDGDWTWNLNYDPIIAIFKQHGFSNLKPQETCHFEMNFGMMWRGMLLLYEKHEKDLKAVWEDLMHKIKPQLGCS